MTRFHESFVQIQVNSWNFKAFLALFLEQILKKGGIKIRHFVCALFQTDQIMDEFPLRDVANVKSALSVKNSRKKLLKSAFFPSNKELKKASRKQLVMRFRSDNG
mmetsp:Transcript_801/g.1769  ORF Transcript_801/g.1769 Transcript_801/m.1769 type:complete len:105 (-) Transcript_801:6-320(-)